MTVELSEAARALIDSPEVAVLTTINADGSPQSSVIWVGLDGDDIVFNTAKGRVKPRNIERDNRVSLVMFPKENPYSYLEVRGTAVLEDDPTAAGIHALSHKYLGTDYPWLTPGEERVNIRITPTKVHYRA